MAAATSTGKILPGIGVVVALPIAAAAFGLVGADEPALIGGSSVEVTYADIAPVIRRECVTCHNPEGSGPFSLLTYDDVRRRAERIVEVTQDGVMPPWLPESEPGTFAGERRLSDQEIEQFRLWLEDGLPPGDLTTVDDAPPADVWHPGEPDLVVSLPTYTVPAEGYDVYRNLVVPIPVTETRWVEYVELRPGSGSAVHHARMMIDATASSRELADQDRAPGFDGMDLQSNAANPDGHFIGWTPGKTRLPPLDGMAWRLDPGTDLVVQLHFRASGSEEDVSAEVEFHFAEEPPTRHPAILVISSLIIDIPAGATDYSVSNSFTLPVDVDLLSVYPHAHYLGKDLKATAILPNGREVQLIHIPDWDFNWQDDYRLAQPLSLPEGTTILKEFSFDNSAENPNNPADPPRRVVYGSASEDEMADLILQVLPRNEGDREELIQAQAWQHEAQDMAYMAHSEFAEGQTAFEDGDFDRAIGHFQEALQYRADHVGSLVLLSRIFALRGDGQSAMLIARQGVMMSNRQDPEALDALSAAHALLGNTSEALDAAEEALRLARAQGADALVESIEARIQRLRGRL